MVLPDLHSLADVVLGVALLYLVVRCVRLREDMRHLARHASHVKEDLECEVEKSHRLTQQVDQLLADRANQSAELMLQRSELAALPKRDPKTGHFLARDE